MRLECFKFYIKLRLGYVLKMFLNFSQSEPRCSHKQGSYKQARTRGNDASNCSGGVGDWRVGAWRVGAWRVGNWGVGNWGVGDNVDSLI